VAKQDEVEPTDGSDAAEPFDATDELTADQPGDGETVSDNNQRGVQPGSPPLAELSDLEPADQDDEPEGDADVHEPDDVEPVDEFDEIVRNSGVGGSGEEPPETGPADNDAAEVLQPAGVAARTAGTGAGTRGRTPSRTPKTTATAKRDQPVKRERTTPLRFVRQSIGELRKVVYPTGQQLINYFIVVLVFVLFVIAYVSLLDLGLGAAIFRIFS
jgi:preprotein translocase subunit SecE